MGNIKKVGRFLGKALGTVTGEPIKFIGKKLDNDYIQEIGDGVKKASTNTGHIVGSFAEGTYNTAAGFLNEDERKKDAGLNELKQTSVKTAKGIGHTLKNTAMNGLDVVEGAITQDKQQLLKGAKGIGKTAAVGILTVGVLDGLDIIGNDGIEAHAETEHATVDSAADQGDVHVIETRNDDLEGSTHAETGVAFERETIALPSGETIQGVFPQFDSQFDATMPDSLYLESDDVQFHYANDALKEEVLHNDAVAEQFSAAERQAILAGHTPDGYTWHHSEYPGKLQLVDEETHAQTGHTGGRELWGGGSEYRQ